MISLWSEQLSLAREDSDPAPQASKKVHIDSRLEGFPFTKKDSCPAPQASKKGRRVPEWWREPRVGVEDFVPWVAPIYNIPPTSEEKEEEDEMADLVHSFEAQKRKRGVSFKRVTDASLEVVGEVYQHLTGEGSDGQAIVVVDSPEMDFHG